MKRHPEAGSEGALFCCTGGDGWCEGQPAVAYVPDDWKSGDDWDGDAFCDEHAPERSYPRWEVSPDEPGGLAWVTSADEFEAQVIDIEGLFLWIDWRQSESASAAVAALVDIVKTATQPQGEI